MLILALVFIVTYPFLSGLYSEILLWIQDAIKGG